MNWFKENWIKILLLVVVIATAVQFFKSDTWHPVYYPNPTNLTNHVNGPVVDSLEQCRDWIEREANRRGQTAGQYDYECGLNCNYEPQSDLSVCEDTKN